MDNPSSTSNSRDATQIRRLPLAFLIAVAMVLIADSWVLGVHGPWKTVVDRMEHGGPLAGIVYDRLALRWVLERKDHQVGAFVIGSSRALHGFKSVHMGPETRKQMVLQKIAHPSVGPFEIRSMADEVLDVEPDAVVIIASEFDTHRPIWIVPKMTFGSFSAIRDFALETGARFSFNFRNNLYRLGMVAALNSYRYRDVLGASHFDRISTFELDERFPQKSTPRASSINFGKEPDPQRTKARHQLYRKMLPQFPEDSARYRTELAQIFSIRRGSHPKIQENLIERAIRRFRAAGTEVILAEAPLHPLSSQIYDTSIRQDFLDFAKRMETDHGTHFIPLESSGPFPAEDFLDLTHLKGDGSKRFSTKIIQTLHQVLNLDPVPPIPAELSVEAPSHEAQSHEAPSHEAPSHEARSHEARSHETPPGEAPSG